MSDEWFPARIEYAPKPTEPWLKNYVCTVAVPRGFVVDWHWTHTKEGSFVSGYNTRPAGK